MRAMRAESFRYRTLEAWTVGNGDTAIAMLAARRVQSGYLCADVARADGRWSDQEIADLEGREHIEAMELLRYHRALAKLDAEGPMA